MSPRRIQLGLIPQDTRPVSLRQVLDLADAAGCDVFTPDHSLLGHRDTPGDRNWIHEGALSVANEVDLWVLSMDMVLHGGLVPSRTPQESAEALVQRMQKLRVLRQAALGTPIYGFQSIRRLAGWVGSAEELERWKAEHEGDPERDVREIGHRLNLAAIDLTHEGALDVLNLLQEDARLEGPHREEQAALAEKVKAHGFPDRVTITPGTDEGARVLVARAVWIEAHRRRPRVALTFSSKEGAEQVARYEDRPVRESAAGQVRAAGGEVVAIEDAPDLILAVWCPGRPSRDLFLEPAPAPRSAESPALAAWLEAFEDAPAPLVLADVADANGADPAATPALVSSGRVEALAGYAAWNTASNSLGCALAQGLLSLYAGGGEGFARFRALRLLEDWGFQTVVRPKLMKWIEEERKGDPWELAPDDRARAETFVETHLGRFAGERLEGLVDAEGLKVALPWSRAFEVGLSLA